jgi:hypothetical protein
MCAKTKACTKGSNVRDECKRFKELWEQFMEKYAKDETTCIRDEV